MSCYNNIILTQVNITCQVHNWQLLKKGGKMPGNKNKEQVTQKLMFTIQEAVKHFGISAYSIRMGIRQGIYPAIKIGGKRGKYLIDSELFESTLRIEAIRNMKEYRTGQQNHEKI